MPVSIQSPIVRYFQYFQNRKKNHSHTKRFLPPPVLFIIVIIIFFFIFHIIIIILGPLQPTPFPPKKRADQTSPAR